MKEAYVNFEIAKLLKKRGFDWGTQYVYTEDGKGVTPPRIGKWKAKSNIPMVTHQMACAWCRNKGYHIYTFKSMVDSSWVYEVQSLNEDWTYHLGGFENHDDAIEAALKYTLENLYDSPADNNQL